MSSEEKIFEFSPKLIAEYKELAQITKADKAAHSDDAEQFCICCDSIDKVRQRYNQSEISIDDAIFKVKNTAKYFELQFDNQLNLIKANAERGKNPLIRRFQFLIRLTESFVEEQKRISLQ